MLLFCLWSTPSHWQQRHPFHRPSASELEVQFSPTPPVTIHFQSWYSVCALWNANLKRQCLLHTQGVPWGFMSIHSSIINTTGWKWGSTNLLRATMETVECKATTWRACENVNQTGRIRFVDIWVGLPPCPEESGSGFHVSGSVSCAFSGVWISTL